MRLENIMNMTIFLCKNWHSFIKKNKIPNFLLLANIKLNDTIKFVHKLNEL
jgi:hypothetical protein